MPLTHLTFVPTISDMHMHIISDIKQFDIGPNLVPKPINNLNIHIISAINPFDICPNPQNH